MSIRDDVSAIVGYYIPEHQWDSKFSELDAAGKITPKVTNKLLVYALQQLEMLQTPVSHSIATESPDDSVLVEIASLKSRLAHLENPPVVTPTASLEEKPDNEPPGTSQVLPKPKK